MLFKTEFLLEKQHLPVFALNPQQQPLELASTRQLDWNKTTILLPKSL